MFPDGLVKKLEELEKVAEMYKGLIGLTKSLLKTTFELSQSHKGLYLLLYLIVRSHWIVIEMAIFDCQMCLSSCIIVNKAKIICWNI